MNRLTLLSLLMVLPACKERTGTEPLASFGTESVSVHLDTEATSTLVVTFHSAGDRCPGLDPAPRLELGGRELALVHHSSGGVRSRATLEEVPPIEHPCYDATTMYAYDGSVGETLVLDGGVISMQFAEPIETRRVEVEGPEDGTVAPDEELTLRFSHADATTAQVEMSPLDVPVEELGTFGPGYTQTITAHEGKATFRVPADVPDGRLRVFLLAGFLADGTRCDGASSCVFTAGASSEAVFERR